MMYNKSITNESYNEWISLRFELIPLSEQHHFLGIENGEEKKKQSKLNGKKWFYLSEVVQKRNKRVPVSKKGTLFSLIWKHHDFLPICKGTVVGEP